MKKILCIVLVLLTLVSAVPAMAVSADEPAKSFADVKEGKWYYEGVMWCAEQGYMAGESETHFAPSKEMTRAMLVTVLAAIAEVDTEADEYKHSEFVDVKDGKWYTGAVVWANANNIANGISDDTFGYKNPVTREQLVVMVYQFMQMQGVDVSKVNENKYNACGDTDRVHSWAVDAMKWALDNEIISGTGTVNGAAQISPRDTATRAQIAVIVKAMLNKNLGGEYPVGSLTLGGSDISEFAIVYGEAGKANGVTAEGIAQYLCEHILVATGITLPIYADTELPATAGAKEILVGKTNREDAGLVSVDRSELTGDAFLYEMKDNYLILASNEKYAGTHLAANRFLEDVIGFTDCGNGIFAYSDIKASDLANGTLVCDRPYMDLFVNYQYGGWNAFMSPSESSLGFANAVHSIPLLACTGCDAGTVPDWNHHTAHYLDKDPCLSDINVINTIIKNLEYVLENNYNEKSRLVWVSQGDDDGLCMCDRCTIVYRTFGRCATYLQLLNLIADTYAEKYPDAIFVGLSYMYTITPPKLPEEVTDEKYAAFVENYTGEFVPPQDITGRDNVAICITMGDSCSSHAYNDPDCQNKAYPASRTMRNLENWRKLVPTIYVWDYVTQIIYRHGPFPNLMILRENVRYFAELGVTGYWPLGESGYVGEFNELRTYLVAILNEDPYMSEAEYSERMNIFLETFYGDGWTYVREYIDITSALTEKSESHFYHSGSWDDVVREEDWRENEELLLGLWENALKYAGSEEKQNHVRIAMTHMLYVQLQLAYHDYEASKDSADLERFTTLNKAYVEHLRSVGFGEPSNWSESRDPDQWGF